jgi:cellulose synthase/poly-beta-1,6-N-acetylglucosamine synthase-like glycosyltransferase
MTLLTACAGASLYYHAPILCSGANLIYEKDAFLSVNGFEETPKTATGDDIFLMLKFFKRFPSQIKYLKSKDAVVFTHPENYLSEALRQRKRWASKFFLYEFGPITWVALLVFLTNFFILLSAALSIINSKFVPALITIFFTKVIVDYMLLYQASSFFGKKIYSLAFVFNSILYPVYVCFIGLSAPLKNYSWKGRKMKYVFSF